MIKTIYIIIIKNEYNNNKNKYDHISIVDTFCLIKDN